MLECPIQCICILATMYCDGFVDKIPKNVNQVFVNGYEIWSASADIFSSPHPTDNYVEMSTQLPNQTAVDRITIADTSSDYGQINHVEVISIYVKVTLGFVFIFCVIAVVSLCIYMKKKRTRTELVLNRFELQTMV